MGLASFFQLELDTTPPILEIFSPNNASSSTKTRIRVQANEELLDYQNIYALDEAGKRQNITFIYHKDYFETDVIFKFNNQIITIIAQLKDVVGNISNIATKTIRIINGKPLYLETDEKVRNIIENIIQNDIQLVELEREVIEDILTNDHHINDLVRKVDNNITDQLDHSPIYDKIKDDIEEW